jgi:hypothetical protein
MIKNKRILHLTDFHLHDIETTGKEHFRKDFYKKSYLPDFFRLIKDEIGQVDCIIATGDFVDRGNSKNFPHAQEILEHFADVLNLSNKNIGVCIGNHDLNRDLDFANDLTKAREDYYQFAQHFSNGRAIITSDRFCISEVSENVYFLSLDATLNRNGKDQPGKLTSEEINIIVKELNKFNTPNNLIIVGSHYPLSYFEATFPPDEDGFFDRHFWRSGEILKDRIQREISQPQILWLFGDTHQPAQLIKNNHLFVMSGRIGTKVEDPCSNVYSIIDRQAKIIQYRSDNSITIRTLSYSSTLHTDNDQLGTWSLGNAIEYKYKIDTAELIDQKIEKDIEKKIQDKKLYKFGRFVINDGEDVSLGWISINNLLTDSNLILLDIVNQSRDWLVAKIQKEKFSNTLIIGIDFWGAIIASQISAVTGLRNYIVGSRGDKKFYSLQEILESETSELKIDEIKNIVFITDVVSSGRTLENTHNKVVELFKIKNIDIENCYAISVISDRRQKKKVDLGFLSGFGTFCSSVRLPVVNADMLPDEVILPPKKYFK